VQPLSRSQLILQLESAVVRAEGNLQVLHAGKGKGVAAFTAAG
jgi:hypothetical protein